MDAGGLQDSESDASIARRLRFNELIIVCYFRVFSEKCYDRGRAEGPYQKIKAKTEKT